ncbi:MAG: mechanosensitive ion channel [Burkholderiaceae bacterium]|nr:mechanosensitive ion channel [Burkholderiaceae bacterium]
MRRWPSAAARRALFTGLALLAGLALLLPGAASAAASETTAAAPSEATLRHFNRDIVTFRAPAVGMSPAVRAQRAADRIAQQLAGPGPHAVTLKPNPLGTIVQIDGAIAFFVTPPDVDVLREETQDQAAERAAAALREAIEASKESRQFDALLRGMGISLAATAVGIGLLWLLRRVRRAAAAWLVRFSEAHVERLRISGVELIRHDRLVWAVRGMVALLSLLVGALAVYTWVGLVLSQFPYSRVWGVGLKQSLVGLFSDIGGAVVDAVPGLATATVIFFITRFVSSLLDAFFMRAGRNELQVSWLDPEVLGPTRRLAKILLWLFALAMAYPYLPGAQTEAFKGLSVLIGLMLSIGSSNLVGHAGSGLILTYARVYRRGEYVRIGDHEGTITELGTFVTRLRTGLGEEVTLSNSLVLGAVTKNYSRAVKGAGFVLDTTVTIGYDTPWRQVQAMLGEAARRTPGVLADPPPTVFQTALSDFYPEYRLVCQAVPHEPRPRALVLSVLHANIQDVFNEHGVQIMSPHYFGDPDQAKLVPRSRWFAAPARADDGAPGVDATAGPRA